MFNQEYREKINSNNVISFDSISNATHRNNLTTYEKGISAELCASKLLESKGYKIIKKRTRTPYGEIDILAKRGSDVVAVEVKQRKSLDVARSCILARQQKRIVNALLYEASNSDELFESYRVDVICLDSVGRFEHIENAFPVEELVAC